MHAHEGPHKCRKTSVCVCADLHREVQQVFDHSDLPAGGRRVEGGVSPLVLAADLGPLAHKQTRHIQMTCRGRNNKEEESGEKNTTRKHIKFWFLSQIKIFIFLITNGIFLL